MVSFVCLCGCVTYLISVIYKMENKYKSVRDRVVDSNFLFARYLLLSFFVFFFHHFENVCVTFKPIALHMPCVSLSISCLALTTP